MIDGYWYVNKWLSDDSTSVLEYYELIRITIKVLLMMELHYKYSHQYRDTDKWCHMYCMVGAEFMWLNQINQYGSDIETIYMRSGIEKCFILSCQKYIKVGEVCIYDQLIIIKQVSINAWRFTVNPSW